MEITREQLEQKGLKLSNICDSSETYVNEDYSIRIFKCKTKAGWMLSAVNNFGEELSAEPFSESV